MSTPLLFDVHTHTHFAAFTQDSDAVIQRALDTNVWIINVGTQANTSRDAIEAAKRFSEGVFASVGLHPIHTQKSYHDPKELGTDDNGFTSRGEEFDKAYYGKLAQDQKVVAIGECGLDYYRLEPNTKEAQVKAFTAQITLAHEVKKPLMIHCRNAFGDLISMLDNERNQLNPISGVIHFFTGSKDDAKHLLDLGFSFSFGGVITFTHEYDEVVSYIPIEYILLETDAPYVTPIPYRGKRNEPSYVVEVAKKITELKKISYENTARITTKNARMLFNV